MNNISFHNITPAPLAGVIDLNTRIWEKELSFEKGKKYKIFAPSGKGKSTFMHIIYGIRSDFAGELCLDQTPAAKLKKEHWAEIRQREFSIVFQDLRLFLELTALENIKVNAVLTNNVSEEKINSMAETLGITRFLHKKSATLSYGERQRVAIIRALVQPFDWLLLDEPFSHLDKENIKIASTLIEKEVEERKAGMLVTSLGHDDFFKYDFEYQL